MTAWKAILSGAIGKFIPGVLTFLGGSFVFTALVKGIETGPAQVLGFTLLTMSMTAGYLAALGLMRPSLEASAGIEGRRSYVAGLGATGILLGLSTLMTGPTGLGAMTALAVLAGSATTGLTFFPWLLRERRNDKLLLDGVDAIARQVRSARPQDGAKSWTSNDSNRGD